MRRADLNGAHLDNARFHGCDFTEATLNDCSLEDADLSKSTFDRANLQRVRLRGALLEQTMFRDADLRGADLEKTRGLLPDQLAGADLTDAKLPEGALKDDSLDLLAERARNAKRQLLFLLAGCVYALLTVGTTTDTNLIGDSAAVALLIVRAKVSIVWFYCAAPAVLVTFQIYFLLYLQRMWESLALLPAVFPDGRPVDRRVYPWLLNGLVRTYFFQLRNRPLPFSALQSGVSVFVAFWLVPPTLLLLWARYLVRHDWLGTGLQVLLLGLSCAAALVFHRLAAHTLRGKSRLDPAYGVWKTERSAVGGIALVAVFFGVLSYGVIEGVRLPRESESRSTENTEFRIDMLRPTHWAPRAFDLIGYFPFADLDEQKLSRFPPDAEGDLSQVEPARLQGADLRNASLVGAVLAKADLRGTNLSGADLFNADLRSINITPDEFAECRTSFVGSNLGKANLEDAFLRSADLTNASLMGAKLARATLIDANLDNANLMEADLRGAILVDASLDGAELDEADVTGADFTSATITLAQVIMACHYERAIYSEELRDQLRAIGPLDSLSADCEDNPSE